ncbi:NACHT domain-containing protein [Embleya sp. NPDC020886]|uniref:NACHT domain-containing protein n=1 Tax=Embleya sp. NPDC020886 TaxID=3363980 RepID=UPI0037B76A72
MSGIEAAIAGRVAGRAAQPLIERVRRDLARRGRARGSLAIALDAVTDPSRSGFSTVGLLDHLPRGVTNRQIMNCVDTPTFGAFAQQLMAVEVLGGNTAAVDRVRSGLRALLRSTVATSQEVELDAYTALLFDRLRFRCAELVDRLRRALRDETDAVNWAHATLAQATVDSIEQYVAVLAGRRGSAPGEREEWLSRYRSALRLHEHIPMPDFGNRRRVHYSEIFVEPRLSPYRSHDPEDVLRFKDFIEVVDRTVILGDPGAGKSTTSSVGALLATEDTESVPLFVVMREIDPTPVGFSLIDVIRQQLAHRYQVESPHGLIEELLLDGSALLVFDGLDEVASASSRRRASEIIETASRLYPLSRILATSRIVGYRAAGLDPTTFTEYRLRPFDDGEIRDDGEVRQYVDKWFRVGACLPTTHGSATDVFLRESSTIPDLRCNPLLLAYICVLYRGHRFIPRSRAQLYKKCAELLLADWDNFQGLPVVRDTDLDTVRHTLATLAYRSITDRRWLGGMVEDEVRDIAARALAAESVPTHAEARKVAGELVELCRGRAWIFTELGTAPDGHGIFGFTHQSLQEYFAALHLVRNSGTAELLADRLLPEVGGGRWEVLAQICMNLADEKWRGGSSDVVIRLLERGDSMSAAERRTLVEFLTKSQDALRMSVHAMRLLVDGAMHSFLETSSDDLRHLMDPSTSHHEAAWSALAECLGSKIRSAAGGQEPHGPDYPDASLTLGACGLAVHVTDLVAPGAALPGTPVDSTWRHLDALPELGRACLSVLHQSSTSWVLSLYSGTTGLEELAGIPGTSAIRTAPISPRTVLTQLLDIPEATKGIGPLSPALWIVGTLGAEHPHPTRARRAREILAALSNLVTEPSESLTDLQAPRVDNALMETWTRTLEQCDRALRRVWGHNPATVTGLLYLYMGLTELLLDVAQVRIGYSGALGEIAGARENSDPGRLAPLLPRVTVPAADFARRWCRDTDIWCPTPTGVS